MALTTAQKLDRLQKLLEEANKDYATSDEVAKLFAELLKRYKDLDASVSEKLSGFYSDISKITTENSTQNSKKLQESLTKFRSDLIKFKESIVSKIPKDGKDGKDGRDGRDGRDGKDGSPDLAEDIRNKLELLTGDERIDKSAIKGLESIIDKNTLDRAISILDKRTQYLINKVTPTSSGVSATTYTETPSGAINGSNKTYTTTHTINTVFNFAINGQYIHPSDYTASGTTITFNTALDASLSGTSFTIVYQ